MKKDWLTLLSLMGFWFGTLIAFAIFIMNLPIYLVIAGAILSLISGFYFFTQVLFPGTVLFRDTSILHDNASLIKSSGSMIASSLCSGNLYAMGRGTSLPVIKVSLYPKGIWIKLPFIKPIGLFYEEIENFSIKRLFLNIIEIRHNSKRIINPIYFLVRKRDLLTKELEKMISGAALEGNHNDQLPGG